jgi:hypothetical protein
MWAALTSVGTPHSQDVSVLVICLVARLCSGSCFTKRPVCKKASLNYNVIVFSKQSLILSYLRCLLHASLMMARVYIELVYSRCGRTSPLKSFANVMSSSRYCITGKEREHKMNANCTKSGQNRKHLSPHSSIGINYMEGQALEIAIISCRIVRLQGKFAFFSCRRNFL